MSSAAQYFLRLGSPIIAPATAMGGPVAILRVSGRDLSIYNSLFSKPPVSGAVTVAKVADLDKAVVLFFKAPHSFTGEDVLEIQCHGIPSLVNSIQSVFLNSGASLALPGEFSFRSVLNKKMTLEEAEALNLALSDPSLSLDWAKRLVGLSSLGAAAAKDRIQTALAKIVTARGRVEAAIDYPEAESEQASEVRAAEQLVEGALVAVESLLSSYENFSKQKSGTRIVILGSPNVGKSTLLNILAGGERALVSDEAGTTRDFVDAKLRLRSGLNVTAVDTAGIRYGAEVGKVEEAGVERAMVLAKEADGILLVKKRGTPDTFAPPVGLEAPVLELFSHADQSSDLLKNSDQANTFNFLSEQSRVISFVESWIGTVLNRQAPSAGQAEVWISSRQATLMESASGKLREALLALREELPIELCGHSLLEAEDHLRMSIGDRASDEYIGEIFSQFCLGK
jgi:tRNA modification GTPase